MIEKKKKKRFTNLIVFELLTKSVKMLLNFTYYFFKKICFSYKLVLPLHYENKLLKIESSLFNSFLNETSFYKKKKWNKKLTKIILFKKILCERTFKYNVFKRLWPITHYSKIYLSLSFIYIYTHRGS